MEMLLEIRIIEFGTPVYDLSVKLRTDILRTPLGLSFSIEDLKEEYKDIHLGCFDQFNNLLACLVLTAINGDILKMRQVAVLSTVQRRGIGKLLVDSSEIYAKQKNYHSIELNARELSIPFYTMLGYQSIDKSFTEVGIEHIKMQKILK